MKPWAMWLAGGLLLVPLVIIISTSAGPKAEPANEPDTSGSTAVQSLGAARFPLATPTGVVIFNPETLQFERIKDGTRQALATVASPPDEVIYAPTGTIVATRTAHEDQAGPWTILSLDSGVAITDLAPEIGALAFSPDGKRIIYHYRDSTTSNLSTAELDGSRWQAVLEIPRTVSRVWWLQPVTRVLYEDMDWETFASTYHLVGLSSRSQATLDLRGQNPYPNPSSAHILLAANDPSRSETTPLSLLGINAEGAGETTTLPYNATPNLTGWAAEADALYLITPDLVRVEASTGQATTLITSRELSSLLDGTVDDIRRIHLITVHNGLLYFVFTNQLWAVRVPQS